MIAKQLYLELTDGLDDEGLDAAIQRAHIDVIMLAREERDTSHGRFFIQREKDMIAVREHRAQMDFTNTVENIMTQYKLGAITCREAADSLLNQIQNMYNRLPVDPEWEQNVVAANPGWTSIDTSVGKDNF